MKLLRTLALALVAAGCRGQQATPTATDAASTTANATDAGAPLDATQDARAVLDAWQKAQNAGDFASYEPLYAARFEGVRRSGSQVARLDRARWMKERARMMKQKTEVSVRDVTIVALADGAELRFVQTWSSESYKDEGEKRIVLAREKGEKGKLLIAREEMLRSITFAAGAPTPEKLMFVATNTEPPKRGPGAPLLVSTTALDEAWLKGPPRLRWSTGPAAVTERDVDPAKLPPEIKSWTGREVELFGPKGAACAGKVSGFLALGRVTPHFGTRAHWTGTGDFQGEPPMAAPAIAAEAWSLAGKTGRVLTFVVSTPSNEACRSALWGRATTSTKPALVGAETADAATLALLRGELAKTKEYAAAQKDYDAMKEPKDPKRWEDFDSKIDARVFKTEKETLATIAIRAGSGCGSFGATLTATFKISGTTLTPFRPPFGDWLEPVSAGDVDGDGAVDLVWAEGLLRGPAGATSEIHRLEIPFLDCGC